MKTRRSKATDIPQSVKREVWERDGGRCVVCGNHINTMPNAHYIARSKGGLGCPHNIVTLCTDLTPNKCHSRYDNGTREEHEEIGRIIREYLMSKYPDWNEEDLIYNKWR